jgi:hypothetical protein
MRGWMADFCDAQKNPKKMHACGAWWQGGVARRLLLEMPMRFVDKIERMK